MNRALVLNATYQPLSVVPLRRAVLLVLAEKAEVVEEGEGKFSSASLDIPEPLVVRLTYFVRVPFRASVPLTRRTLLSRDNRVCGYCNGPGDTIDHIVPRSRGGKHRWENVVCACRHCNHKKRDRTPEESGMTLHIKPSVPAGTTAFIVAIGTVDEKWQPYLQMA